MQPIEHSDADDRTSIEEFTDAELSAILRSRLKIVTIENDEERPEDFRSVLRSRPSLPRRPRLMARRLKPLAAHWGFDHETACRHLLAGLD